MGKLSARLCYLFWQWLIVRLRVHHSSGSTMSASPPVCFDLLEIVSISVESPQFCKTFAIGFVRDLLKVDDLIDFMSGCCSFSSHLGGGARSAIPNLIRAQGLSGNWRQLNTIVHRRTLSQQK